MSKMKVKLILAICQLIFVIMFLALAVNSFLDHETTNGILWLILCQLYTMGCKEANKNDQNNR